MDATKLKQNFEAAVKVLEALAPGEGEYVSLNITEDEADVWYHVLTNYAQATRRAVTVFGKLDKSDTGVLNGKKDNVKLRLYGVLECVVVGTKTERRQKVIKTNEEETVEVPVYECRVRRSGEAA